GISMLVMNIPLFIISIFVLGKRFGARTLYGIFITSLMTDLVSIPNLHKFGVIKDIDKYSYIVEGRTIYAMMGPSDIYLSAIAGAVLLGLGLGIIFRFRGSTGGTDIPVAIIKQKTGLSIGTGYWIIESAIILLIGFVFHDMKLIIWGYINLFISARITDLASEGLPYVKGVYIISEYVEQIKEEIYKKLQRGVTYFHGEGGYTGKPIRILFCAMTRRQVAIVRDVVKDIDPEAFMLLTDVSDVMGLGFKTRNLDLTDE
ncbi:MAG: YitT family protein, partial [Candidatus Cloacimonetes bacterium]|nr:YitT family protein [Candidatus Cloacimonadota bacterium]